MEASTIAAVLGGLAAVLYGFLGISKIVATADMKRRADRVNFSVAAYRRIGVLEVLAALGLIAGYAWTPAGVAAAVGLLFLMAGALAAHLRVKAPIAEVAPPLLFVAVIAGYLVAMVAS